MLTATEKQSIKASLLKYEGSVPHMYLDTEGNVTVGIGHLLKTAKDAEKLSFVDAMNKKASKEQIQAEFDNIKKQLKGMKSGYYKRFAKLMLDTAEINRVTESHISNSYNELKIIYAGFTSFPSSAKLALFDF